MLDSKIYTIRINGVDESNGNIKLLTGNVKQLNDLEKSNQDLLKLTQNLLKTTSTSYKTTRQEVKLLQEQLVRLNVAGDTSSKEFQQVTSRLGLLKHAMLDAAVQVKLTTNQYDLFGNSIVNLKGVINTLSLGVSALALFGDDEDYQKTIKNLIAVQNLVQGLSNFSRDMLNNTSGLGKIYADVTGFISNLWDKITGKTRAAELANIAVTGSLIAETGLQALLVSTQAASVAQVTEVVQGDTDQTLSSMKHTLLVKEHVLALKQSVKATKGYVLLKIESIRTTAEEIGVLKANILALETNNALTNLSVPLTQKAAALTTLWGNLMKMIPILAIIAGITALVSWLSNYKSASEKAAELAKKHADLILEMNAAIAAGEDAKLDFEIKHLEQIIKDYEELYHADDTNSMRKLTLLKEEKLLRSEINLIASIMTTMIEKELNNMHMTVSDYYAQAEQADDFKEKLAEGYKNGWKYQNLITEQQKKYAEGTKEWTELEQQRWKSVLNGAEKVKQIIEPLNKLLGYVSNLGDKFLDFFINKMGKGLEKVKVTTEEVLLNQIAGWGDYYDKVSVQIDKQYVKLVDLLNATYEEEKKNKDLRLKSGELSQEQYNTELLLLQAKLNEGLLTLDNQLQLQLSDNDYNYIERKKDIYAEWRDYQIAGINQQINSEILEYDRLYSELETAMSDYSNKYTGYNVMLILKNLSNLKKEQQDIILMRSQLGDTILSIEDKIAEKKKARDDARLTLSSEEIQAVNAEIEADERLLSEMEKKQKDLDKLQQSSKEHSQELVQDFADFMENINGQLLGLIGSIYEMQIEEQQKYIDKVAKQLESTNLMFDKSTTKLLDLRQELRNNMNGNTAQIKQDLLDEEALNIQLFNTQQRLEREKQKAEEKAAQLLKKQRKADAVSSLISSIIATALGVTKASPNLGLMATVGILGAIQAGIITAQISKMEDGGLLQGKSHKQGGIPVGNTGVEVEGGEYVVNKKSTARYLPLLEEINANKGINSRLNKLELGGQLNTPGLGRDPLLDLIGNLEMHPVVSVVEITKKQLNVLRVKEYAGY